MISFSLIEKSALADAHFPADSAARAQIALDGLELIRAFFPNPAQTSEALKHLEVQVQSGRSLRGAFVSLSDADQQALREQIPPQRLDQILTIASPRNGHFWEDALYIGGSLKREETPVWKEVLGWIAKAAPPEFRAQAQEKLAENLGRSMETLISHVPGEVSDYKKTLPLMVGTVVGPVVEATVLGAPRHRGNGRALGGEGPGICYRGLDLWHGGNPFLGWPCLLDRE